MLPLGSVPLYTRHSLGETPSVPEKGLTTNPPIASDHLQTVDVGMVVTPSGSRMSVSKMSFSSVADYSIIHHKTYRH
jgi:hypothetical protein